MVRFLLLSILLTIVLRAGSVLWSGIVRGLQGQSADSPRGGSGVPQRGVHMVRDPICGTFIVPDRAVALAGARGTPVYFCSAECRDKYRALQAPPSPAHGRTA